MAMLSGGFAMLTGGIVCRHYGRKWNQGSGFHMMYWIPLEIWGWIYLVFGGFFFLGGAVGILRKGLAG